MAPLVRFFDLLSRNTETTPAGIASVCSAHPRVIAAAIARSASDGTLALIEATCNQVNHEGGYTGLDPADFAAAVLAQARRAGIVDNSCVLGGDHLGPNPWRHLPATEAMAQAKTMIAAYARAGFAKLHLDTSMSCVGDPDPLPAEIAAARAAELAVVAEEHAVQKPVYVVGTEVPTPGGATHALTTVAPTRAADVADTLALHRGSFAERGLGAAWQRVVAVVVQPGVEFGTDDVHAYDPAAARDLVASRRAEIVFEAHSTDYQSETALGALVRDGFAFLKVGPELTFAMREAFLALDAIEAELLPADERVGLRRRLEDAMQADPQWWRGHHDPEDRVARLFSLSDRARYYWPALAAPARQLVDNLRARQIPAVLIRQFLPRAFDAGIAADPDRLIAHAIDRVLARYAAATSSMVAR